jgi:hypothetical protein
MGAIAQQTLSNAGLGGVLAPAATAVSVYEFAPLLERQADEESQSTCGYLSLQTMNDSFGAKLISMQALCECYVRARAQQLPFTSDATKGSLHNATTRTTLYARVS